MEDYENNTSEKSGPEIKQKMLERHSKEVTQRTLCNSDPQMWPKSKTWAQCLPLLPSLGDCEQPTPPWMRDHTAVSDQHILSIFLNNFAKYGPAERDKIKPTEGPSGMTVLGTFMCQKISIHKHGTLLESWQTSRRNTSQKHPVINTCHNEWARSLAYFNQACKGSRRT